MRNVWNYLNGRKTWLGVLISVIYLGLVGQGIIQRNEAVEWAIVAITGVGVGHKIYKA